MDIRICCENIDLTVSWTKMVWMIIVFVLYVAATDVDSRGQSEFDVILSMIVAFSLSAIRPIACRRYSAQSPTFVCS